MTELKLPSGYDLFLKDLKERVRRAQLRASLAVNRELVLLYWSIGRDILTRQKEQGWGAKIVERLAADLRREFPEVTGFSPRNLTYMRAFAEAWPDEPFVQQLVAQIPWGHNVRILDYVKNPGEREWYIRETIQNGGTNSKFKIQNSRGERKGDSRFKRKEPFKIPDSEFPIPDSRGERRGRFKIQDSKFKRPTKGRFKIQDSRGEQEKRFEI